MAKTNICHGTAQYWHRPAYFPSEAIFVGTPQPDRPEDDGVLLFVSLSGAPRLQAEPVQPRLVVLLLISRLLISLSTTVAFGWLCVAIARPSSTRALPR